MAQFLLLNHISLVGDLRLEAGTIIDDLQYNTNALVAAGAALVPYSDTTLGDLDRTNGDIVTNLLAGEYWDDLQGAIAFADCHVRRSLLGSLLELPRAALP